jgi:hypothetical protein
MLMKGSLSYVSDADMQIRPLVPISDSETQSQLIQEKKDVVESQRQADTRIRSILFLAADPTNESRLRLGEEFREIDEQLRLAKQRDQFKLELPQLSLRPRDITGALLNVEPEIVHFLVTVQPGARCALKTKQDRLTSLNQTHWRRYLSNLPTK